MDPSSIKPTDSRGRQRAKNRSALDLADPLGVAGVFKEGEVVELIQILHDVKGRAAA